MRRFFEVLAAIGSIAAIVGLTAGGVYLLSKDIRDDARAEINRAKEELDRRLSVLERDLSELIGPSNAFLRGSFRNITFDNGVCSHVPNTEVVKARYPQYRFDMQWTYRCFVQISPALDFQPRQILFGQGYGNSHDPLILVPEKIEGNTLFLLVHDTRNQPGSWTRTSSVLFIR